MATIRAVSGDAVELDKSKLDLLMAGVTAALSFAGTEHAANQIRESTGDVQEAALSGSLIVGDGGFNQVAAAVQLIALRKIFPASLGMLNGNVGIQVAVGLLRTGDKIDDRIRERFKFFSRTVLDAEGSGLDPFIKVRILEDGSLMPPLDLTRRDAEIIDAVGRLHIGKAVVERLPLVRDELLCHIADVAPEQLIRNADLARFKRLGIVLRGMVQYRSSLKGPVFYFIRYFH